MSELPTPDLQAKSSPVKDNSIRIVIEFYTEKDAKAHAQWVDKLIERGEAEDISAKRDGSSLTLTSNSLQSQSKVLVAAGLHRLIPGENVLTISEVAPVGRPGQGEPRPVKLDDGRWEYAKGQPGGAAEYIRRLIDAQRDVWYEVVTVSLNDNDVEVPITYMLEKRELEILQKTIEQSPYEAGCFAFADMKDVRGDWEGERGTRLYYVSNVQIRSVDLRPDYQTPTRYDFSEGMARESRKRIPSWCIRVNNK